MEQSTMDTTARALERDIEHDRQDLDRTLTKLQEKLTIEHLVAETRHHLANGFQSAAELVRRHPLPAAAVVLLATGAMVGRSRSRSRQQARWMHAIGSVGLHGLLEQIAERSARAANGSADVLNEASQLIPERVAAGGREMARQTHDLLHEAQRRLQSGGQRVQERVESFAEHQPGLLNALASALGGALVTALSRRR
jgi:hypothetical protein